MTTSQQIITIALVVLGTVLTRALPFIIFPEGHKPPKFISYLGTVLPYAVIGMLVVYCLRDAVFSSWHALPELIVLAITAIVHKIRHSTLLSIAIGTAAYMLLVQNIF